MKTLLTHGRIFAVPVLLAWTAWAAAQSLGQPVAELWIGRPLDVTIPARFASTDSRDTCVQAEVAYGGTRLAPSQVHATVIGEDEHRRVRITSEQLIDEPLVTVTLRAGCGNSLTRTYALLPDMPSEAVLARIMQGATAVAQAVPQPGPVAALALPTRADARARGLRLTPAVAHVAAAPRAHGAKAFRLPVVAHASRPRLHLDAIEADAASLLRVSATLSQPGDAALRAQAALLWQAINADPRELVHNAATLQKLENELAQLRQTAGSTRAEMASLRQRLDATQPWYLSPRLVQGLALLALVVAGAVALLAWRTRRATEAMPWYTGGEHAPLEPQGVEVPVPQAAATVQPVQRRVEAIRPVQVPAENAKPSAPRPAPAAPVTLQPLDFAPGEPDAPRAARQLHPSSGLLRVETLAATFEEAEFLVSLGLHSDAMDVLKSYLQDCANPAPVAFFELMRVCRLADDPQAVEAVRRRYAKLRGAPAPTLEYVSAPGGLEQQRTLAERIVRAWNTPEILPLIEQALFEPPPGSAMLTAETARDLICLYDLAMLLVTDMHLAPRDDADHPLAPWAHAEHAHEAQAAAHAAADEFGGHRFGLDVDLSVAPQALPEKAPEPDPQVLAARLLAEKEAARRAAERAAAQAEDAFSAAVASERFPISRY